MTLPYTPIRRWMTCAAAMLLLATSTVCVVHAQPLVYPRAGVSSDAYRTPPQRLSIRSAQPLIVQGAQSRSASVETSPAARPVIVDPGVVTVDHREPIENVSGGQNQQSVRSELQRLYAEDGLEMPNMRIRSYQQQQPAATSRAAQAAPPVARQREDSEPGLLAGLFGFGRPKNTSRSAAVRQPPQEPAPFRPPTYRQQPQPISQQQQVRQQQIMNQRRAVPLPQEQSTAARQQIQVKSAPPKNEVVMQNVTPRYDDTQAEGDTQADGDAFFPADATGDGQIGSRESAGITSISDDLAEFFPADPAIVPATPAVDAAADSVKAKMRQLLQGHKDQDQKEAAGSAAADDFRMPIIAGKEEIIPQPAPAAVSEYVATNINSNSEPSIPSEPAPFFADEERAIDPQEALHIVAITGETFDPSGTDSAAANRTAEGTSGTLMQQIAARDGVGFKGYCPVALRDERRLADGRAAYVSYHQSKAFYFSSLNAKLRFDARPSAYAPASAGEDVTMKTLTGEVIEGSLDHSVWYKNRLYLFDSAENLKTFMAAPGAMAVAE